MGLMSKKKRVLVLENIRSTHNVGSIFRTASACAVTEIVCVGITPTPVDRFGNRRNDIAKVALGAENMLVWRHCDTVAEVKKYHALPFVGVERTPGAIPYHTYEYPIDCALVLGSEVGGLSKTTRSLCDAVITIPMAPDGKESLNVSVACGIVLYRSLYA